MDLNTLGSPQDLALVRDHLIELVAQRRLPEARGVCQAAREQFPEDAGLAAADARIHLLMADFEAAAAVAAEALGLGTEDPMVAYVLGAAHRNCGRPEAAAEALIVAHRLMPTHVDAAIMAIEEAAKAHGLDAAQAYFDEAFERCPEHRLQAAWAVLRFNAGLEGALPAGIVAGPVQSIRSRVEAEGREPVFVGEREAIPVEVPPVFGEASADRYKAKVAGYEPYVATLADATIFAKSSLIVMPDGGVVNDTVADSRFGRFLDLPHEKLLLARRGDRLLLDTTPYDVAELDGGVMLSGWASEHYGHWVPEFLCRIAWLERHPRFADLPIIVDSDMPAQHLQYLSTIVPNPIVQIPAGGAVRCRELIVASPSTFFPMHLTPDHEVPAENQGGISVEGARLVQRRVLEKFPLPSVRTRKIYLSRRSRGWRRLLNDDELCAALSERGFEILFPEEMTFEEQVRMYQSARIVVAPNGSSMLNAMFASRDLVMIALSQRGLFNWGTFYGLMRELGHDLTFYCNDDETAEKHADYRIEVSGLLRAINSLLGESEAPGEPLHPLSKIPVARPRLPRLGALAAYIERIDDARWYSNFGPLCEAFEARLAARFGLDPANVCTISNATLGLELALKSAGAKPGTLCLVPSWTFAASVHAVLEAGLQPCLMDVDASGVITPALVRRALAMAPAEVGAIMPVAVCGQPIDPQVWEDFSLETGIPVVLDTAPGFDTVRASSLLAVVSLHATKVLGIGEGGFVVSKDRDLIRAFRLRANFGFQGSREALTPATNGKISEYAAAIGLAGLDEWEARRVAFQAVAMRYRDNLRDVPGVSLPPGWGERWVSTTCVVTLEDPAAAAPLLDRLHAARVETRAWWGRGMHTHRAFADLPRLALPMTERLADTVLGLPFYIDMGPEEVDRVCGALRKELIR